MPKADLKVLTTKIRRRLDPVVQLMRDAELFPLLLPAYLAAAEWTVVMPAKQPSDLGYWPYFAVVVLRRSPAAKGQGVVAVLDCESWRRAGYLVFERSQ